MSNVRNVCINAIAALSCAVGMAHAQDAQQYPSKPVRFIIGFAPGGFTDLMARLLAGRLSEMWGQQVVADNRPGGGSIIATEIVAKAPPDGYTLLMMTDNHVTNPSLFKSLPYDSEKHFAPITLAALAPFMLLIHPSLPVKNVKELIALAKARPGQLTFGSGGIGGPGHLAGEMLNSMAGIKMVHVPYKGAGPAVAALLAGEIQVMVATPPAVLPHIRSGRLRALAYNYSTRASFLPDVPTMSEAGLQGTQMEASWHGMLAPAKTPAAIIARLEKEIQKAVSVQAVRDQFAKVELRPVGSTSAEFRALLVDAIKKLAEIIKIAGIQPE
jgi:tripartite-type tricarboxylate transporter receptor subunit TctC